jgi:hypothetical protein
MKYTINIEYTTGDSFHTEETEQTVELEWENVEIAKKAMKRIQEHNEWANDNGFGLDIPRPSWHKTNCEDDEWNLKYVINLPLDDGTEQQLHCFWSGYFENVNALEVIAVEPIHQGMRIEV